MALTPAFVVSAASPYASGYDPASPDAPYASVYLSSYGGLTDSNPPYRLPDQAANDELFLGFNAADPSDENNITNYVDQIFRRNVVNLGVALYNLKGDEQILLVYGLRRHGNAVAQFFVGGEFVQAEPIDDPTETIALLLDVPGAGFSWLPVYLRIAGQSDGQWFARALFTGVEGFII